MRRESVLYCVTFDVQSLFTSTARSALRNTWKPPGLLVFSEKVVYELYLEVEKVTMPRLIVIECQPEGTTMPNIRS
jgi:hypothetical protein